MKRLILSFIIVGCFIGNLLAQEALGGMQSITVTGIKQTKKDSIKKPMKIKLKPNPYVIYCQ